MTVDELKKITAIITRAYSSETFDSLKMQLYYDMLKDTDYSLVEKNLMEHINKSSFAPKINELKKTSNSYHEIGKQILLDYTREVRENRKNAVPCPPEIKEELRKFFEKGD